MTKRSRGAAESLSDQERENLIRKTMRVISMMTWRGEVISFGHVWNNHVLKSSLFLSSASDDENAPRAFVAPTGAVKASGRAVFAAAAKRMSVLFGIRLVRCEPKPSSTSSANDVFFAVNAFGSDRHCRRASNEGTADWELARRGLLMIVLSHLFVHNGSIAEKDLWSFLRENFDLTNDENSLKREEYADTFGLYPEATMRWFVKQKFLKKVKSDERSREGNVDGGGASYDYRFGPRTVHEIGMENVIEFLCRTTAYEPTTTERRGREENDDNADRTNEEGDASALEDAKKKILRSFLLNSSGYFDYASSVDAGRAAKKRKIAASK